MRKKQIDEFQEEISKNVSVCCGAEIGTKKQMIHQGKFYHTDMICTKCGQVVHPAFGGTRRKG